MPHNVDFSKLKNVKTLEINPEGWITPIYVEYAIEDELAIYGATSYFWRVKGTLHTFIIPVSRMDYLSSGDYKKHFENALENFKADYVEWQKQGFTTEWSKEYYRQFYKFIVI